MSSSSCRVFSVILLGVCWDGWGHCLTPKTHKEPSQFKESTWYTVSILVSEPFFIMTFYIHMLYLLVLIGTTGSCCVETLYTYLSSSKCKQAWPDTRIKHTALYCRFWIGEGRCVVDQSLHDHIKFYMSIKHYSLRISIESLCDPLRYERVRACVCCLLLMLQLSVVIFTCTLQRFSTRTCRVNLEPSIC